MAGPPPHISQRRAQRRAEVRRRRGLALLLGALVCAIAAVIVVKSTGGNSSANANAAAQNASTAHHSGAAHQRSSRSPHPTTKTDVARDGSATVARLAKYGLPVYCAGPHGNAVAFTFDDGPGPYTYLALRKLREAHEHATFFVVGRSIDAFPHWINKEMTLAAIGDHSYTHPVLSQLPQATVTSELSRTIDRIKTDTGGLRVGLFRPPYGARSAMVDGVAKSLGLLEIVWNVDSADSLGARLGRDHPERRGGSASGLDHPHAREPRADDPRAHHPAAGAPSPPHALGLGGGTARGGSAVARAAEGGSGRLLGEPPRR